MAGSFIDTNVLVYLASRNSAKADRAEAIVLAGGTISVQVLNELADVARRKMALSWEETGALVGAVRALLRVEPLTVEIHERALAIARRYRLSVYDAMIAASALAAGCDTLWSEDMHDGLVVDGTLCIGDPFSG